jgi:hypothetical protein
MGHAFAIPLSATFSMLRILSSIWQTMTLVAPLS